jgi:hypothetical protein
MKPGYSEEPRTAENLDGDIMVGYIKTISF